MIDIEYIEKVNIITVTKEKMDEVRYDMARQKTKGECWDYLINRFQGNILDFEKLEDGGAKITVGTNVLTPYKHAKE